MAGERGRAWEKRVLSWDLGPDKCGPGDYRVVRDRIVRARNLGECGVCGGPVQPGTTIRSLTDVHMGEIMTRRVCTECCDAMASDNGRNDAVIFARFDLGAERARAGGGRRGE